jgi:uncharacterized LabA/DUF88 family protein
MLNIMPRRSAQGAAAAPETNEPLPEPSPEALEEPQPRARRTASSRRRPGPTPEAVAPEATAPAVAADPASGADGAAPATGAEAPAPRSRRTGRSRARPLEPAETPAAPAPDEVPATPALAAEAEVVAAVEQSHEAVPVDAGPAGDSGELVADGGETPTGERRGRRRRGGRGRRGGGAEEAAAAIAAHGAVREAEASVSPVPSSLAPYPESASTAELRPLLRVLEQHSRQLDAIIRLQSEALRQGGAGAATAAPPLRVGVFVDAANIELACDRLRARLDWKKVLALLTRDRQLVRAITYSPVHDDPDVSIETQRFVEPFLDSGFKVVTKPLRRFQDGSIKANVDIELALDVITMIDRLDVVCLVSGDGDFQRLVELVQSKGVRVEVVGVGSSMATNLKYAADAFIDLGSRMRDLRA